MSSLKELFTTVPPSSLDEDAYYDELERRQQRCFNRWYEHSGTRVRFMAGDLQAGGEREQGGRAPVQFSVDLSVCQEDVPEFYLADSRAVYDIHTLMVLVWRWGVYLSIRGRVSNG